MGGFTRVQVLSDHSHVEALLGVLTSELALWTSVRMKEVAGFGGMAWASCVSFPDSDSYYAAAARERYEGKAMTNSSWC
jgi:hypothetical protein